MEMVGFPEMTPIVTSLLDVGTASPLQFWALFHETPSPPPVQETVFANATLVERITTKMADEWIIFIRVIRFFHSEFEAADGEQYSALKVAQKARRTQSRPAALAAW